MSEFDKTKRVIPPSDDNSMKTRLIRRNDPAQVKNDQPASGQASTRVFLRPRPAEAENSAILNIEAERFVVGWLVVVHGPGRGNFAAVYDGMNSIGRDESQATRVNFGDDSISRSEHAFITYDFKSRKFYLSHGGKAALVRLNDQPVLQPCELNSGDLIAMGQSIFRFNAFCGPNFDWQD
jgi:hypothetical protein